MTSDILTERTLLRIAERISSEQVHLGIHLSISHAVVKQIKASHPHHLAEATLDILMVRHKVIR